MKPGSVDTATTVPRPAQCGADRGTVVMMVDNIETLTSMGASVKIGNDAVVGDPGTGDKDIGGEIIWEI
jgi:hypothetical protein